MFRIAAVWVLLTAILAASAGAAGEPDVGKELAITWCSSCHLVNGQGTAKDLAPPFAAIAGDPAWTPDRLRGFLVEPHGGMPNLALSHGEIDAIIAYLKGVK